MPERFKISPSVTYANKIMDYMDANNIHYAQDDILTHVFNISNLIDGAIRLHDARKQRRATKGQANAQ